MSADRGLAHWIALSSILVEKNHLAGRLISRFHSPSEVLSAPRKTLLAAGVDDKTIDRMKEGCLLDKAKKEIDWLAKKGYTPIPLRDQRYPDLLREIDNPPLVLFCAGEVDVLKEPAVSLVGARKPTPYGRAVTEKLAYELSSRGIVIVSGMARGIDSEAHRGALKGGKTIAVLGSGLNRIYPPENRGLFHKIEESGCVLTEFLHESPPNGYHFPLRNRIISGLSYALAVTEATFRSGSLISAKLALDQNRDVLAVPGSISSSLSEGTNWLIKNGAALIQSWKDIVEELPLHIKNTIDAGENRSPENTPVLSPQEQDILSCLKADSLTHFDSLLNTGRYSVPEILSILLQLELKDLVTQRPGKFYQRKL